MEGQGQGLAMPMASSEERRDEPAKEMVHKTKTIQFLGRTTPIILQNDNGPCPLLAICNVLLLRNHISLSPDVAEVSQERLLSLVAERLIDSNSNVENKDAGYVENQQQNIADAIDLLPRLTTGIDVNTKFRRIDDFEFTSECAIFDLLDIPLYHGWIVDPQDYDTANAIGSKSYNTLMGDLVDLETRYMKGEQEKNSEGDAVDFAAATTATLGVPSPSLSRGRSFDEAPQDASNHHKLRKGDMEQEAELLKAIKLSQAELGFSVNNSPVVDTSDQEISCKSNEHADKKNSESTDVVATVESRNNDEQGDIQDADLLKATKVSEDELGVAVNNSLAVDSGDKQVSVNANEDLESKNSESVDTVEKLEACSETESRKIESVDTVEKLEALNEIECQKIDEKLVSCQDLHALSDSSNQVVASETVLSETGCLKTNQQNHVDEPVHGEYGDLVKVKDDNEKRSGKVLVQNDSASADIIGQHLVSASEAGVLTSNGGDFGVHDQSASVANIGEQENKQRDCNTVRVADSSTQGDVSSTRRQSVDEPDACSSSAHGSEPIYEGEEHILESDSSICKDGEPMYEGEMVLAEQSCKDTKDVDGSSKDELSRRQGELIAKFFKNNASQLTIYGLFCLQDGLKERELGVFFRNNHFNTMFKFDGELYILATDQGYISQPDLVWEKLNEVNGNSVFMTSNFKEFKVENEVNNTTWDEQNAVASTADYLASVDNSAHLDSSFNSDLQLAIALQQKEFEEQPQRNTQQPTMIGSSRLITGPQVPRSSARNSSSSVSPRQEPKSPKDKCIVM